MKKLFVLLNCLTAVIAEAQTPDFSWARRIGGNSPYDASVSIATDASGNVYTTGRFYNTSDFDPGTGTFNLTSNGSQDMFISKLDPSGNFVWAKNIGGDKSDGGNYIAVDASGNVYTTGFFEGAVDFDPGAGIVNSTVPYQSKVISKWDASGNLLWAKNMGNNLLYVSVDNKGSIYLTGYFFGIKDFDPDEATYNLTVSEKSHLYISKLNSSGNFVWAKSFSGSLSETGRCIAADAAGNIYISGTFEGTVDFDPGAAVFNLTAAAIPDSYLYDIFILKLDASGNFSWAKKIGGTSGASVTSINVTSAGTMYLTGDFRGEVDFDPGAGIFNLTAEGREKDKFFLKLETSGNFLWAKELDFHINSVVVDVDGNAYLTGGFLYTRDFDPGTASFKFTSTGEYTADIFISKIDASGNFVWAKQVGGKSDDDGHSIAVDLSGNIYTTGTFYGDIDLNTGSAAVKLKPYDNTGGKQVFIFKLKQ